MPGMRHHGRILVQLVSASFKQQLSYRTSFLIVVIAKYLRVAIYFILFESILVTTDVLGGFSRDYVLIHFFTDFVLFLFVSTTFERNLVFGLSKLVQRGDLDGLLTKPLNPLFHIAFYKGDFYDFITLGPLFVALAYLVFRVEPTLEQGLLFLGGVMVALLFILGVSTIFSSFTFRTIENRGAGRVLHAIFRSAQFPSTAFGPWWGTLFLFVIPTGFVATLPTGLLSGLFHIGHLAYGVIFTISLCVIGIWRWNRSLRRYSSASS